MDIVNCGKKKKIVSLNYFRLKSRIIIIIIIIIVIIIIIIFFSCMPNASTSFGLNI